MSIIKLRKVYCWDLSIKKLKSVNIWHIVTIGKKVVVSCTLCAWPVATTYTVTVAAKIWRKCTRQMHFVQFSRPFKSMTNWTNEWVTRVCFLLGTHQSSWPRHKTDTSLSSRKWPSPRRLVALEQWLEQQPAATLHTLLCHAMHDALHCEFVTRAKRKDKPSLINPGIKSSKHSYTYTESCWLSWCRGERNLCTSL